MNIFVSGKWEEREQVKELMNMLVSAGHTITCDWTEHGYEDDGYPVQYAEDDIDGVVCADMYVGLFLEDYNYKGTLVELGAAIALEKLTIIIGNAIDSCIFVDHPLVIGYSSIKDFMLCELGVNV